MTSAYDYIPDWGQLPAEQYLIRFWDPSLSESTDEQRVRLIHQFLQLDEIPQELDPTLFTSQPWNKPSRIPTPEEVATILRPWRSDQMRWRAWRLWQEGIEQPVLLRTYYNSDDDERVKGWATISEEYADVSDWSVLDDPQLFNSAGSSSSAWLQVFYILPEISRPVEGYSRLIDWERFGSFRDDFKDGLEEVKRNHPATWRNNLNLLLTENSGATTLLHFISTTQMLIADKETFETNRLLLVYLDAKQNITMQGRIDISKERLSQLGVDWHMSEMPGEVWEQGSLGEKYMVDGEMGRELYQWTKEDLESDPLLSDI